ncbi:hypothetical protein ACN38_g12360 [Penicillium nordicum]|uniref:Uncharacterized protein n=1 Tax=Penicillium nordicum TaxID=229535 RepID=A0A0M9WAA5_9EURO|nr:hypothetical protein ACN38_g12360 [Penicillium nordicum]
MASVNAMSPDSSANEQSRSRSSNRFFFTKSAALQGPTGSIGLSGHSNVVASIAVGFDRPPRDTRYFSSHLKSAKHSAAERSQSLYSVSIEDNPRDSSNNDRKVCSPRESMQGDVASGTISSQFTEEQPTSQLLVNMTSDRLKEIGWSSGCQVVRLSGRNLPVAPKLLVNLELLVKRP